MQQEIVRYLKETPKRYLTGILIKNRYKHKYEVNKSIQTITYTST